MDMVDIGMGTDDIIRATTPKAKKINHKGHKGLSQRTQS